MKKMLLFLTLLWVGRVTAQVTEVTEGGDVQQTLNTLFQNVNLSQAPTGILMNKAVYFANIHNFDGTIISDSTDVNINTFGWLYSMMGMAKVGINTYPNAEVLYGDNSYTQGSAIPLVMMCQRYNHFKSTAFVDNLIGYSNNQLFDVLGRTQSPYAEDTLFMVTPVINTFKTGNLAFILSTERIIQNVGGFQSISIDFGTGSGFQAVALGQAINVSLPAGMNRAVIKVQCKDGRTLKCRFEIDIKSSLLTPESGGPDDIYLPENSFGESFWETRPQDGSNLIRAEVTTFYACTDKKLRKPLLILDGFNSGSKDDANQDGITTDDFLKFFNGYTNTPISTSTNRPITQDLRREGYDLIFVNWKSEEGRDDLRRSAALLQKLLAQINAEKARNGSTEKNVIIGISMGGVVGKYALLDLERKNPSAANGGHDVKMFIGYDAPMQGANIPLGFQYLVKDLGDQVLGGLLGRNVAGLKKGLKLLKSSAARQLLTYQAFDNNPKFPTQFTSFYNELNGMGRFQKLDYRTVCNGSTIGTPNFPAGKRLLGGGTPFPIGASVPLVPAIAFAIYCKLDVRTLPPTSTNSEIIYDRTLIGFVRLGVAIIPIPVLPRLTIRATDMRALDGAPGGTTGLTGGLDIPLLKGGKYDDGNKEDLRTTFIPTVSALDIRPPFSNDPLFNVSNEQMLVSGQVTNSNGFVGSQSSFPFDVARFVDVATSENRVENQVHAGLSYRTTDYLLYNLITRNPLQSTTSRTTNLSNRTYNFGSENKGDHLLLSPGFFRAKTLNNIIDYTVNVENTGQLWVNREGKIGFTDDVNAPNNTANEDYTLIIRQAEGCKSELDNFSGIVNVRNNGIIRLADGYNGISMMMGNAPPAISIRKGGTLKIQAGGNLNMERYFINIDVEDGGQLIIENGGNLNMSGMMSKINVKSGGKLIINAGANINLTGYGMEGMIHIRQGGELVINGDFNYTGWGFFQFDVNHKFTLNADITMRGGSKSSIFFWLSNAPAGTQNILKITGHSLKLSNALIYYGTKSGIEINNNSNLAQVNTFTDVFFIGTDFSSTAISCTNPEGVSVKDCNFYNLLNGVVAKKTTDANFSVIVENTTFSTVNNSVSATANPDFGPGNAGASIKNCKFDYSNGYLTSGTACKFVNL
jgi:hypothetical protein